MRVPGARVFGIVDRLHLFHLAFGIVVDHHAQRAQHGHHARRALVQILAQEIFEQRKLGGAVGLRYAHAAAEIANRFRRVAAAAEPGNGGHARIVPAAAPVLLLDQLQQLALAQQRVGEIQPVELDLLRMIDAELFDVPIVERPVIFEFERADGVRDALDGIRLAVREIVHRIDAPFVAGAVMLGVQDAVHDGIAQVEIGRRHVDLGAQGSRAVGKFAGLHALEQIQIFFDRSVAIGAFLAGFGQRAALLADFVADQIADVGLAGLDELNRPFVKLAEIIGGVEQPVAPNRRPASAHLR